MKHDIFKFAYEKRSEAEDGNQQLQKQCEALCQLQVTTKITKKELQKKKKDCEKKTKELGIASCKIKKLRVISGNFSI